MRIIGSPARFTAVYVEKVGHLGKLRARGLKHGGRLRKICDYLLVIESGDGAQAVFVELKKTWSEERGTQRATAAVSPAPGVSPLRV